MPYDPGFTRRDRPTWTPPDYLRPRVQPSAPYNPGPTIIDVTPTTVEVENTLVVPPKPTLDQIPVQRYSRIVPAQFVQHKLTPQRIIPIAKVLHMDWEFDEPVDDDNDNEVRVFVSISEEERAIIKRYGYHHEPMEKQVAVFDDPDLANLQEAQDQELQSADPSIHGFLKTEHRQQMEWAREQKFDLTIVDYLAGPFRKQCKDRYEATLTERKINGKLMEFKQKLDKHRG